MLSPVERKELKARAHNLNPVVMIGAKGLTDEVVNEVELALTYGGKTQRFTRADGEVALGRAFENHISIPVRHVSRRHAKIVWQANGPVLVNLSANGCRVRFDDDGGNAQLCSESMALHGKGVIVLASVSGQSPTGEDTVKFSVGSK